MDTSKMTGLELLSAMLDGTLPHPSMTETVPMHLIEVEKGRVRFSAKADPRHLNTMQGVHGGFAAAVLDSATGCAVHSALDADVGYGTVDLDIKMVRPVPLDVELIATGRLINLSRNIGVSEGQLTDLNGKLYAHATCTCMIIRPTSTP